MRAWPAVVFVYLLLAFMTYLSAWTGGVTARLQASGSDLSIYVWSLRWVVFAIEHGHNPLYSNWVNYPDGVNLLANTPVFLLGLVSAPLTLAAGALASCNLLQTLAFALSAATAYALLSRWRVWRPAAFIGGLLYGFSPYMVSSGWAHLNLSFIALIPLIVMCLEELLVRQDGSAVKWGIVAGLLGAAQFFISSEILADTAELGTVAIFLLLVMHPKVARAKLRHGVVGLALLLASATLLLAYPVWFETFGPQHASFRNPVPSLYSSDLLGPIVPTSNQLFATASLAKVGDRLSGGRIDFGAGAGAHNVSNAGYLGLPLLLLVVSLAIRYWRDPRIRLFALLGLIAFVASLGPELKIDGSLTGITLPWRAAYGLPLLHQTTPFIFGAFYTLAVVIVLAVGLDRLRCSYPVAIRSRRMADVVTVVIASCALIPLIPKLPYTTVRVHTPRFFTTADIRAIPKEAVVLTYPPPTPVTSVPMEWQASSGMRYRMVGAYMFARYDHGRFSFVPNQTPLEMILSSIWMGKPVLLSSSLRAVSLAELHAWHVRAVLVATGEPHADAAVTVLTKLLGRRPRYEAGVAVWNRPQLRSRHSNGTTTRSAGRANRVTRA